MGAGHWAKTWQKFPSPRAKPKSMVGSKRGPMFRRSAESRRFAERPAHQPRRVPLPLVRTSASQLKFLGMGGTPAAPSAEKLWRIGPKIGDQFPILALSVGIPRAGHVRFFSSDQRNNGRR